MEPINVTALSYEDWIALVFDHPMPGSGEEAWYWQQDEHYFEYDDADMTVEYVTRMCMDMPALLNRFSLQQIDQGIWFTFSGFPCTPAIFDRVVPLSARITCIRCMLVPYAQVVAVSSVKEMENCFQMWWDLLLADSFHTADPPVEPELVDTIFETLVQILRLGDSRCEFYALHGLGHLRDPVPQKLSTNMSRSIFPSLINVSWNGSRSVVTGR